MHADRSARCPARTRHRRSEQRGRGRSTRRRWWPAERRPTRKCTRPRSQNARAARASTTRPPAAAACPVVPAQQPEAHPPQQPSLPPIRQDQPPGHPPPSSRLALEKEAAGTPAAIAPSPAQTRRSAPFQPALAAAYLPLALLSFLRPPKLVQRQARSDPRRPAPLLRCVVPFSPRSGGRGQGGRRHWARRAARAAGQEAGWADGSKEAIVGRRQPSRQPGALPSLRHRSTTDRAGCGGLDGAALMAPCSDGAGAGRGRPSPFLPGCPRPGLTLSSSPRRSPSPAADLKQFNPLGRPARRYSEEASPSAARKRGPARLCRLLLPVLEPWCVAPYARPPRFASSSRPTADGPPFSCPCAALPLSKRSASLALPPSRTT